MFAWSAPLVTPRKLACLSIALLTALTGIVVAGASADAATASEAGAAQSVLKMLNAERAANHLPALGWSTALVSSARRHNLTMAKANLLSHQLPGEAVFSTRISQAGVAWHSAAENIGWTTDRTSRGANSLELTMYNEKAPNNGHRLNILSKSVHYVGIDTYIDAHTGKLWLTEDFADVAGPKAPAAPKAAPSTVSHQPIGTLESASMLPGHKALLIGWALDPDSKAAPLYVGVYYDGKLAARYRSYVARPDVASQRKAGPNQGYCIVVTLPAGRHTIATYALNTGAGSGQTLLGSKVITS
ncbi:MAG: CAP domain-containing protein [Actinomycetota bacterium]|nr:CAP domain-containing protein [Actinomycetota bacterium]MDQ2956346.1 CAP domain-containing protein [Actinomycetota bacterium]